MHPAQRHLLSLIQSGETLSVEFKSDARTPLPDTKLVEAVVALANTQGGHLLLGVEDNGTITGIHPTHESLGGLPALIANRTQPALSVLVERVEVNGKSIAHIVVPNSRQLVSTSDGVLLRRRLKMDGTPEAVPFYPHEFIQRQSAMGLVDPSNFLVEDLTSEQLEPVQRERLREAIKKYGGETSLLSLSDTELEGALCLSRDDGGVRRPTVTGLLLLGSSVHLRQYLPAHEVAFQVLKGTDVKVNEYYQKPILETFEAIELLFNARVEEEEIQVGLFRVPAPNYDRRAFREALVNALVHRDYNRLGPVIARIDDDGLSISNPGGFVEGVTVDNLLVADPRSRNPLLADTIKRIGLAERTGRGIDRIFEGLLRYGRPAPDYSLSSDVTVLVRMSNAAADLEFLKVIVEEEGQIGHLPIDSLIILSSLHRRKRLSLASLTTLVQKPESSVRLTVETLLEMGFLESHGSTRSRTYTLSAALYRREGKKVEYIRQAGFSDIQHEQMVLQFIEKHGTIKNSDVMKLCHLDRNQAYTLINRLKRQGRIRQVGNTKGAHYVRNEAT